MASRAQLVAAIAIAVASGSCKIANVSFTGTGDGDGGTSDAAGDAPSIDAKSIDAGDDTHNTCNPVAQTGCNPGHKCTWIVDVVGAGGMPDTAHIGCAADGAAADGSPCTGGPGVLGVDDCIHGTSCLHSVCEALCALNSLTNSCGSSGVDNCEEYVSFYSDGPNTEAGVCEPACDPLAQKVGAFGKTTGTSPACPIVAGAAGGCYGVPEKGGSFSCAPAGSASRTDGYQLTAADGGPFLNSCAPGNISIYSFTISGANVNYCQGFCLPSDTYSGTLLNQSGTSPYTCLRAGVNGNNSDSCIFSWSLGAPTGNFDPTTDMVSALEAWSGSASGTGLGVCFNLSAYEHFDPTNVENGVNQTQSLPSCSQVGIIATVNPATCTAATPCNTAAKTAQIFGAVELGCVSFETAQAHPETFAIHKRPLANLRFGSTATLRPQ